MKKLFKKSIACLIAVLMVFSSLPITAFAASMSKKTGVTIAGYENNFGIMYYTNQASDYAFSVIKEADKNGVITVEKGKDFQITQSFGTWVNDNNTAAGDTAIASKGLHWHYGDSDAYVLASVLSGDTASVWNAHLQSDNSKIQSAVGGTFAGKSAQNDFRAVANEGGTNEATGIYYFTPASFPQLNIPGEYKVSLWSSVGFSKWNAGFLGIGAGWESKFSTQDPIEVTIRVVDRYTFNKIDGSSTDVLALNADAAKAKAPALKETTAKTHKDGTDQHAWTEYSWAQNGNTFTEIGSDKTEACSFGEVKSEITKAPTCTENGVKTCNKTCAVCNYNKVWTEDIYPTDHTYVYTPATVSKHTVTCEKDDLEATTVSHNFDENNTCTDCGMIVDFSTFDAAVEEVQTELENSIYTEESVAQVQEILNNALAVKDDCANQDALDALAATLTESLELLQRAAYSITFVTDTDGITDVNECEYQYGDVITLDAGTGKVLKWTVEAQNGTTNLGTTAQSIEYVVTRDAVITVYVTQEAESETEKYSKVTFEGHNGAVVAVMYVKEGETLDTSEVAVPAISFYESKGWDVATVTGTGSDITVRAIYKAVGSEKCTVTFGDFRKDYDYDAFVYLKDADENTRYAMYDSNDNLLTYFVGKEFYVPHTDAIVIREATEDTATSAITGYYKDDTKLVYNSKFYLPENTTLVKAGVEVTVDGKTVKFYADKVSARNEFSYAIDFGSLTGVEVKARSFVEYKDADGNTQFAYSEYVTETL